jgi:energy-coupling factor transporter ATP-binding protein EcfA2
VTSEAPPVTGLALQVKDLRVSYGPKRAVDGVSLDINEGEIFRLLGPNGAGKTSTLSAIEGLLKPTSGSILRNEPIELEQRHVVGAGGEHCLLGGFRGHWHPLVPVGRPPGFRRRPLTNAYDIGPPSLARPLMVAPHRLWWRLKAQNPEIGLGGRERLDFETMRPRVPIPRRNLEGILAWCAALPRTGPGFGGAILYGRF